MAGRFRRRAYRGSHRTPGQERALQHIREAQALSKDLGGTDKDVKDYFFALPPDRLDEIMTLYGATYGADKRAYAEKALPSWRSGRRHMSGLVAGRLFDLLPRHMPFDKKYELVENLWRVMGPSSHRIVRIGLDATEDQIIDVVGRHVNEVVTSYSVPAPLQARFQWLSEGDVKVQEQLLNHLRQMEMHQTVQLSRVQIPSLLKHMQDHGDKTHRLAQVLQIGKHKVELLYDAQAAGVSIERPQLFSAPMSGFRPSHRPNAGAQNGKDYSWLLWVALGIALLLGLAAGR